VAGFADAAIYATTHNEESTPALRAAEFPFLLRKTTLQARICKRHLHHPARVASTINLKHLWHIRTGPIEGVV
jgi:hypothetical protein